MAPAVRGPRGGARRGARSPTRRFPVVANASAEPVRPPREAGRLLARAAHRAGALGRVRAGRCRRSRPRRRSSRSGRAPCSRACSGGSFPAPRDRRTSAPRPRWRRSSHDRPSISTGEVALVTGSTRGIGRAIARALHAGGRQGGDRRPRRGAGRRSRRPSWATARSASPATWPSAAQVEAAVAAAERPSARSTSSSTTPASPGTTCCSGCREEDWDAVLDANLQGRVPHHEGGDQGDDEAARRAGSSTSPASSGWSATRDRRTTRPARPG